LQQNDNGNSPQIKSEPGFAMNEPMIKQEPGAVNNGFSGQHPGFSASIAPNNMVARERAAQQLQSKFGQQATASINALQNGTAQGGQLNQTQHQGQPQAYTQTQSQAQAQAHAHAQAQAQAQAQQAQRAGQPQQQQQLTPQQQQQYNAQYQRHLAAQQAQQQQQRAQQAAQANGQNGANPSQMDGSSEAYDGVLVGRDADGNPVEMGRLEIDSLLHEQIASRAKQMEGGGLMLPLKEATKHRSVAKKSKRADGPSQLDGFDDDGVKEEEVDEDAINSDLDDPDDDQEDDDEDDDSMGHIMLCMYDKVQRVKNKW
jgi:transcription initiation factor TFIIA large subunit